MDTVNRASVPSLFGVPADRLGADSRTSGVNLFARIVIVSWL